MADQAEKLRNLVNPKRARTLAVIGAKGGIGRTSLVANLSLALARIKSRVCAVDFDFRLSNLSLFFNKRPTWNLSHVLEDGVSMMEALYPVREGVVLLGGANTPALTDLDSTEVQDVLHRFNALKPSFDYLVIDTPGEISCEAETIWNWVDELLVVTTPEPASLMGTYSLLRRLNSSWDSIYILVNRAQSKRQEREILDLICRTADEFLDYTLTAQGGIPEDYQVYEALCRRQLYLLEFEKCPASRATCGLAQRLENREVSPLQKKPGIFNIFSRIV